MLEKIFKMSLHGTTTKREVGAGIITFLTVAYVLIVCPEILGMTGMDKSALFTATALSAIISTLLVGLMANLPVVQAPGLGLATFFSATVVLTMGYSWQFAITAVLIESVIFLILSFLNVPALLVNNVPRGLRSAIPVGIGFFITFIGLKQSGVVVTDAHTIIALGSLSDPGVWVTLTGLVLIAVLEARKIPGSILIGVLVSTALALVLGVAHLPEGNPVSLPPNIDPIFFKFEWGQVFSFDMLIVVFIFLMIHLFDALGALIGVITKAGLVDKNGHFPQVHNALKANTIGATMGACLGVSTVSVCLESTAGVIAGGRTGLTSVSTACMFVVALFLAPIFLMIPAQATAPALIMVGLFMLSSIVDITFDDITESLPAFLIIILMPFTGSVVNGIQFGFLCFILLKLLSGRYKEIPVAVYVIGLLFALKIAVDILTAY